MSNLPTLGQFPFTTAYAIATRDEVVATEGAVDQVFAWMSVTKPLTALAALIAVDQGKVGLNDPIPRQPFTLRHLLAHASGLPFSEASGTEGTSESTEQVIQGRLLVTTPRVQPDKVERRRIYSNLGFELMAEYIASQVGQPFSQWATEQVIEPLELDSVSLPGSPAYGAQGNVLDVLALGSELLAPSLISAELAAQASQVQFPGLMGVVPGYGSHKPSDWGYGYEIKGTKSPHWTPQSAAPETFGHFGASGSYLLVDPVNSLVAAFLGEKDFGETHRELWPQLGEEAYRLAGL